MAQRIPDSELAGVVDALVGWELRESTEPRDQPDVFVLALSPGDVGQRLEEAWLHDALAALGLADLVTHS